MSKEKDSDQSHIIDLFVKKNDRERVEEIHDYDLDIEGRQIYLFGREEYIGTEIKTGDTGGEPGIEYSIANRFIRNINILMRASSDPILIHLKSCGGLWEEGMAIYDTIKSCPNPITILSYTHARSMTSLILQAANKRVLMPHSYFMIHDGTNAFYGTEKSFFSYAEHSKRVLKRMMEIYVDALHQTGSMKDKSKDDIYRFLRNRMDKKEEVYLEAKEAVKLGFADSVFGEHGKYDWSKLTKYTKEELSR